MRLLLRNKRKFPIKKHSKCNQKRQKLQNVPIFQNFMQFLSFSGDFRNQNVENHQKGMILLSNGVVLGDKCGFVKKGPNDLKTVNKIRKQWKIFFKMLLYFFVNLLSNFVLQERLDPLSNLRFQKDIYSFLENSFKWPQGCRESKIFQTIKYWLVWFWSTHKPTKNK